MILLVAVASWACGPDFPDLLLDDRGKTLLELPEGMFDAEVVGLVPPPTDRFVVDDHGDPATSEREGLTDAQWAEVLAMRAAPNEAAAWSRGADLPQEVRLYTAGAVAWKSPDDSAELACARWQAVLDLPADQRRLRGVWAAYMLAPTAMGDDQEWTSAFDRVRQEARAGAADPAGLAVASLGQEARRYLWGHDHARAVQLYAEQAALGSSSGATSLLFVARELAAAETWREDLRDPLVRDLLVTWAWTHPAELDAQQSPAMTADALLAALDGAAPVAHADRMAALAYDRARYDQAGRWAALAPSPLSSWVVAKLALRRGDLDRAALAYQEVVHSFVDGDEGWAPELRFTTCRLQEERGALALARGEYTEALEVLVDAAKRSSDGYLEDPAGWEDAAYVAERVLTVDELRAFVDRTAPLPTGPVDQRLRAVLARRLVRNGRAAEAVGYFDDPALAAAARDYADVLAQTTTGRASDRAKALLEAGQRTRPALELLGTEVAPDFAVFDGEYDRWGSEDPHPPPDPRFVSADELRRAAAAAPKPDRRFHYREVAADYAEAAADQLPPTTQAYAVALCQAASHVRSRDPDRFAALWERYVRTGPPYPEAGAFGWSCPPPDWDAADRRIRQEAGIRGTVAGTVGLAGIGLGLLGLAGARIRRDRARRSAPGGDSGPGGG